MTLKKVEIMFYLKNGNHTEWLPFDVQIKRGDGSLHIKSLIREFRLMLKTRVHMMAYDGVAIDYYRLKLTGTYEEFRASFIVFA